MSGIWREPREESIDLYPGLVVHDGRQGGSITPGRTRLPMWCVFPLAVDYGWEAATSDYYPEDGSYEEVFGRQAGVGFIGDLMQLRGEFARLLLVLADAERCDRRYWNAAWWETKRHRKRVGDQLRRCLKTLEAGAGA